MVTCYTPNSQNELARLSYRMEWEDAFLSYLKGLDQNKPLILCGDLNVAHEEIDLKNPKTNRKNAGFTDEERAKMTVLLSAGFTDTFRHFYPYETRLLLLLSFLSAGWYTYHKSGKSKTAATSGQPQKGIVYETDLMECQRSARLHAERLRRIFYSK